MTLHSIVIPVFNEEAGLSMLFERLKGVHETCHQAGYEMEIVFVNDGSADASGKILDGFCRADARFKVLHFARNFGHQIAVTAGIEWARGQTVTLMDADLQDPPELILEFLKKWKEGFEVVYAVRRTRHGETLFKRLTARFFYRAIQRMTDVAIPLDTGDFRLMDRKVVEALRRIRERHRFIRGLVSWVGFRQTGIPYDRAERKAGETHYPLWKMIRFAFDGITSFSTFPLQISTYVGLVSALGSFFGILYTLYLHFVTDRTIQGWSSIMIVVLFLGGVQLLALGVIGEYLGRTYDESRQRPLYILDRTTGFPPDYSPR